jgi:hypothetical protein
MALYARRVYQLPGFRLPGFMYLRLETRYDRKAIDTPEPDPALSRSDTLVALSRILLAPIGANGIPCQCSRSQGTVVVTGTERSPVLVSSTQVLDLAQWAGVAMLRKFS